jgi:uncharacterized membrane protein YkgB
MLDKFHNWLQGFMMFLHVQVLAVLLLITSYKYKDHEITGISELVK